MTPIKIPTGPIKAYMHSKIDGLGCSTSTKGVLVRITTLPNPGVPGDPISVCAFVGPVKENILSIPSFPGPPLIRPYPPRFRIGDAPGAGKGMFATRDLRAGELIAIERSLFVGPKCTPGEESNPATVSD